MQILKAKEKNKYFFIKNSITYFVMVGSLLVGSISMGNELEIAKKPLNLDFNTMIENTNKQAQNIHETMKDNIIDSDSKKPIENEKQIALKENESKKVKEFLDVELGLGDSSTLVDSKTIKRKRSQGTQVEDKNDSLIDDSIEFDNNKRSDRGPSSVAQTIELESLHAPN